MKAQLLLFERSHSHCNFFIMIIVTLLILFDKISSFQPTIIHSSTKCNRQGDPCSSSSLMYHSELGMTLFSQVSPEQGSHLTPKIGRADDPPSFELWLDLRQTKISPLAALSHLTDDLWGEFEAPEQKSFLVDKILVSSNGDALQMKKVVDDMKEEYEDEIEILFHVNGEDGNNIIGTDSIFILQSDDVELNHVGQVLHIYDDDGKINIYRNPLPAFETLAAGQWLVIDTTKEKDTTESLEAIASLVQLCHDGSNSFEMIKGENVKNDVQHGGMVIQCATKNEILHAGGLIKSTTAFGKDYVTTDSGILVQAQAPIGEKANSSSSQQKVANYAILIPFDHNLWKSASFVINEQNYD